MKEFLPRIVLVLVLIVSAVLYIATVPSMPDVIASQFRGDGFARSYMGRDFYLPYILVFGIGLPLFLAFMISVLPRIRNSRKTGFAAGKPQASLTLTFGWWFASFMAVFVAFVHWLVFKANQLDPPQLSNSLFLAALIVFLTITLSSVGYLIVRSTRRIR